MSMEIRGPKPVVNPIAGIERPRLPPERQALMRAPDGTEQWFTWSNARDLNNRPHPHKWEFIKTPQMVNPMPSIGDQQKAAAIEDARRVLREAGELPQDAVVATAGLERKDAPPVPAEKVFARDEPDEPEAV